MFNTSRCPLTVRHSTANVHYLRILLKEVMDAIRSSGDYETSQGRLHKRPTAMFTTIDPVDGGRQTVYY